MAEGNSNSVRGRQDLKSSSWVGGHEGGVDPGGGRADEEAAMTSAVTLVPLFVGPFRAIRKFPRAPCRWPCRLRKQRHYTHREAASAPRLHRRFRVRARRRPRGPLPLG